MKHYILFMVTSKVNAKATPILFSSWKENAAPEREVAQKTGDIVDAFLAGRNERTLAAYRQDLADFQKFVGAPTTSDAAAWLLSRGHGYANAVALKYKAHLVDSGFAASTINRRLSALRSVTKFARTTGLVNWKLEVKSVRTRQYRDTRGPGVDAYRQLVAVISKNDRPKARRDLAILRLLFDVALRRGEVVGMDLEDLDIENCRIRVVEKGSTEKQYITIPEPTRIALSRWLDARGCEPGPLFTNFDRAGRGRRLTGHGIYCMLRKLSRDAGISDVRPHALRHSSITEALNLTNGNVRSVQRFSRHRDIRVLCLYDDAREDLGGEVARILADSVKQ